MDLAAEGDDITRNRDTGKLETRGLTRAVMTLSALAHLQQARIKTSLLIILGLLLAPVIVLLYCLDRHQAPSNKNVLIHYTNKGSI